MPQINQLSSLAQVSSGDQIPVYAPTNGDARRMSVGQLLQFFQQGFASPGMAVNFYPGPTTGFSIAVPSPAAEQQWMILQPAGTLATGTITLPLNTSTLDGTEVLITSTQQITALTLSLNGAAAVVGAPPGLTAGSAIRLRYYTSSNTWYSIAAVLGGVTTAAGAFLATPSSANLAAAVTDETGTGALVFGTSPTLVTPVIGAATGTSLSVTGNISSSAGGLSALSVTATDPATGMLSAGPILVVSSAGKIGYGGLCGGTVTQGGAVKTQAVTLDFPTGEITTNAGNIGANANAAFAFSNNKLAAGDLLILHHVSGGTLGAYDILADTFASGSCNIRIANRTAGGLAEAIVIRYAIVRGDT